MADVSKIKLPNNTTVNIKDSRITDKNMIVPIQTKTYDGTSFYATSADNWNLATRYFMSVKPDSSTGYWHVKYRITIWIPASTARSETAIIEYFGYGITLNSYKIWNTLGTTYATYYHAAYWLTASGLSNGYAHAIGESILYASNYTTSSWYRHMIVSLLEYEGCTVTLLDTPLKWSEWTGGNATNYARGGTSPSTYNATSAGLQESGDSDSNSVCGYDAKAYNVGDTAIPAYNPIGEDKDGLLVPMLSKPFLARGPMYVYSSALSASATGSWVGLYYTHYNIQIRNGSSYVEGVAYKPLYLKGTISDGMFTANSSSPYATALPSSEDNLFYYYLGETTTSTASSKYTYISLKTGVHPIYYYKNGGLKLWSGDNIPAAPGTLITNATTAQTASSGEAMSGSITLHKVAKTGTYSDLIGKPTIPSAPGTLNTTATTAQSTSSSEALSGNITLHKVAKTGTYSDLVGKPTVDSSPTASSSNLVSSGGVYTALQNILSQIVSFDSVSSPQDGTLIITLSNGDTITVDLNHSHPQYPKYEHLASESSMPANPDADTMYLIDGGGGGGASIVYLTDESQMPASPDANTLYVILESQS